MRIKRALTFRASSIGDCLMGKYLLENIYAQFSDARLGIVVGSRGDIIRDLFAAYPWLEVIEANRRKPHTLYQLIKNFYGSDLVVTQYAGKIGGKFSFTSKIFARMLAKRGGLIGFRDASKWNRLLYSNLLPFRLDAAISEHEREVLKSAGLTMPIQFPTLEFKKSDSALKRFEVNPGKFIIVHLFAGSKKRGLYPNKKEELLNALGKKFPHIQILISGGANDRAEALQVTKEIPAKVIAQEATLQEMMNLIKESRAVVSVDTGIAHIAAQLGKPLNVMRTCIGPNWWFPEQYGREAPIKVFSYDEKCMNGHISKDYPDCINSINFEEMVSNMLT